MSSGSAEAHGLPAIAPPFAEDRPLGEPSKFLVFHTVASTPAALHELLLRINTSSSSSQNSVLAPAPDFTGRPLRDVYDHFVTLREQDETVYPFYFIVADRTDFLSKGVLGICLDCSLGEGEVADVGVARCEVDLADSWGADFYNKIADWVEMKDEETMVWGEDGAGAESEDVDPEQKHADEATKYGWDVRTSIILERNVYAWYSLVEKGGEIVNTCLELIALTSKALPINRMLDPSWLDKTPDQCRFQMLGSYHASTDPWAEI